MKLDLATLRTAGTSVRVRQGFTALRKLDRPAIKKRLQTRSLLALTLEADRLLIAVVRTEGSEGRRAGPLNVPVGAEELFRNPEKAGQVLAATLETAGIREKRCAVCVPPSWALSASTDLPAVGTDDLRGYLELRAEREFSLPPGEMRLAFCPYDLPDGQRRATLAAITGKRLQAVETMAAAAGRRVMSVSLALNGVLTDAAPRLHLHADGRHADVIVTAGGGVAALRSLPGPAPKKSQEDAGAGIPAAGVPDFDAVAFCREVRITLGRLPAAVREGVREVAFGGEEDAVRTLRTETAPFFERMGLAAGAEPFRRAGAEPVSSAASAAARYLRGEAVPFEFIVPVPGRWEGVAQWLKVPRHRQLALIALAVILLPVLVFFVRGEMESNLQDRWRSMRDNVAELDALQGRIRRFRPWFDPTPRNLRALDQLMAAFPETGEVWAKNIQIGSGYKVTCTGFARNDAALQATLARLRAQSGVTDLKRQQSRGADPIQFSFTYKWDPDRDR